MWPNAFPNRSSLSLCPGHGNPSLGSSPASPCSTSGRKNSMGPQPRPLLVRVSSADLSLGEATSEPHHFHLEGDTQSVLSLYVQRDFRLKHMPILYPLNIQHSQQWSVSGHSMQYEEAYPSVLQCHGTYTYIQIHI